MKKQFLGAVILGALAAAAAAQSPLNPQIPPKRGAAPTLAPPASYPTWPAQRRSNHVLGASQYVQPTILPATGRGLPPGAVGKASAPAPAPRPLPVCPGPIPAPSGTASGPPLVDDLAGPGRSQPLLQGFEGPGPGATDPPSPDLAVGFDHVMAVTSDELATYDKAGNELLRIDAHAFFGVSTAYVLHEPRIVFDPWNARWVVTYEKDNDTTEESSILIAVTNSHLPFGLTGGWVYDMNVVQTGASGKTYASGVTLGFSNDYLTLGGNMRYFSDGSFLWSRIWVLDKAAAYTGAAMGFVHASGLTNPDGSVCASPCAVEMQVSWAEGTNVDGTWINSRAYGGSKLTHWKIQDVFGTNTITAADIDVGAYSYLAPATEPDGTSLHAIDERIESAVTTADNLGSNGVELFTGFNEDRSGTIGCNLFKIDPVGNTLKWEYSFGSTGFDYFNPRVAADYSGSAFWVFTRTGNVAGYYPEARFVDYKQGLFSNSSSLLHAGDSCYSGYYWGFYAGGQMDWGDFLANNSIPGRPSKVWLYNQYTEATSWGTYIGATSVFSQGYLSSVTPSSTWYISGTVGGYFVNTSRDYTLTNTGEVGLAYEVTSLPPWLTAAPGTGHLTPGSEVVQLSIDMDVAKWLTPGIYTADVVFQDTFNGGSTYSRHVELNVAGDGVAYCSGEVGEGTPCPCNNDNDGSLPDAGCANGAFASGAKLIATGDASVSADTIQLVAANVHPSNSGLFFQADNAVNSGAGLVFGDGLRCAGGALIRLQVRFANTSGVAQTSISVSSKGGISAGETKRYQYWYRDNSGHQPCGVGVNDFNLTNGLRITWGA